MKKAWELSVLCAADVSILIFSNNGKPYEFSSKDLDSEFDRYLDVSHHLVAWTELMIVRGDD
jgi:MADS-box transcription factor